ncbi:MAG: hypothetical protein HQL24_09800 [Candidatus Omnitrophica bacterium]|nr:hypothetical protein [Candidatus Omnitrophota bacterium]
MAKDTTIIATTLIGCVKKVLESRFNFSFSKDSEYSQKDIIEYNSRMKASGLEKFNAPCHVAAINFYQSPGHMTSHDPFGAVIFYISALVMDRFYWPLGFKSPKDDEEEDRFLDDCAGELAKLITEQLKTDLSALGYKNLTLSEPLKAKNSIMEGVEFNYNERKFYEVSFYLWKQKALVVDISLAPV